MDRSRMHRTQPLSRAIALATIPTAAFFSLSHSAFAQTESSSDDKNKKKDGHVIEEVMVTASRRSESVQDIPINITAVNNDMIEDLRLDGISEISRYVPGLTVIDRGPRDEVPDILVRGLNTTSLGPGFGSDTVATYFGDVPLLVDVKPVDLERVEVLIGPQGTLYGQGTMGGAIRYIPKMADSTEFTGQVRGNLFQNQESDDVGGEFGFTINLPIIENILAARFNFDHLDDPGFIDYNYAVKEGGVSNPEDPNDWKKVADANGEETDSLRFNLRFTPNDLLDLNLWYYTQDTEAEGRQITHEDAFNTGEYESAYRYVEPNEYDNELISFTGSADLGFAEATLVAGHSEYEELGQRDQTDLLINFEYGYEFFPSFSSYTREVVDEESDTYELRVVSLHGGPVSWVVGYFSNETDGVSTSEEFTPGFDQFAVDEFGGVQLRPDALEYYQYTDYQNEESAFYGEITLQALDSLAITLGYRRYEYSVDTVGAVDLPLLETVFNGRDPESLVLEFGEPDRGSDDGDLFKFNIAYDLTDDDLLYFTYSEGYRNGGVNSYQECTPEDIQDGSQALCALPDELIIDPDSIDNYEIGYKGILLENRLSLNAALYFIDWQNAQVSTVTQFGSLPITGNTGAAESKGLELSGRYIFNDNWEATVTYAYTNAKLTEDAPSIYIFDDEYIDALSGARLPGHSEHQASFNLSYTTTLNNGFDLAVNYGFVYFSDVFNVIGGDDNKLVFTETGLPADYGGEALDGYDIHQISATLSNESWTLQAYIDNLLDEYYVTGTRSTRRFLGADGFGIKRDSHTVRSYGKYVGAPRTFGVRLSYQF